MKPIKFELQSVNISEENKKDYEKRLILIHLNDKKYFRLICRETSVIEAIFWMKNRDSFLKKG